MNQNSNQPQAKRSKASLIILIVLALLLMMAAVILVYQLPDDEADLFDGRVHETDVEDQVGFDSDPAQAQRLYPFADGLYQVSESRIVRLDNQGNEEHAVDVDFEVPFALSESGLFWTGDRDGHRFILLDEQGERYRGITEGRISSASISPDGHLAIVQDQANRTGLISVYDPVSGDKLYDCYFPESGYVLSVSFTADGEAFDVALLNTQSASATPIIKRYDISGQEIGQRLPDYDEIFPLVMSGPEGQIILAGAGRLLALTYEHDRILWQQTFHEIQTVAAAPDGLLAVAASEADRMYSLHHIDATGQVREVLSLGEPAQALAVREGRVAIGTGSRVIVVEIGSDEVLQEWILPAEVIRLDFADDEALLVVTRTGVRRLNLTP